MHLYKALCPSLLPDIKQLAVTNCLALNVHGICLTRDLGFESGCSKCYPLQNIPLFPLIFLKWDYKANLFHFVGCTCSYWQ